MISPENLSWHSEYEKGVRDIWVHILYQSWICFIQLEVTGMRVITNDAIPLVLCSIDKFGLTDWGRDNMTAIF